MKFAIALFSFVCVTVVHAAAPTPASLDRLLAASGAQKVLDSTYVQMESLMRSSLEQAVRADSRLSTVSPERVRKSTDEFAKRMVAVMREEMSWDKLKAYYSQAYMETFSQEEVDGLIQFYESPAGQAFVAKMPALTQKMTSQMQVLMMPLMQKMQVASKQFAEDLMKK